MQKHPGCQEAVGVLEISIRVSLPSRMLSERRRAADLALARNRERFPDNSFLDSVRPNATHTDFFPSGAFGRLDANSL
jgi:hypothetical protein